MYNFATINKKQQQKTKTNNEQKRKIQMVYLHEIFSKKQVYSQSHSQLYNTDLMKKYNQIHLINIDLFKINTLYLFIY